MILKFNVEEKNCSLYLMFCVNCTNKVGQEYVSSVDTSYNLEIKQLRSISIESCYKIKIIKDIEALQKSSKKFNSDSKHLLKNKDDEEKFEEEKVHILRNLSTDGESMISILRDEATMQ